MVVGGLQAEDPRHQIGPVTIKHPFPTALKRLAAGNVLAGSQRAGLSHLQAKCSVPLDAGLAHGPAFPKARRPQTGVLLVWVASVGGANPSEWLREARAQAKYKAIGSEGPHQAQMRPSSPNVVVQPTNCCRGPSLPMSQAKISATDWRPRQDHLGSTEVLDGAHEDTTATTEAFAPKWQAR